MSFKVMKERCDQCLYGPDKIVSNARRRQLLQKVHREDGFFECHKATMVGDSACCRGDFDQHGGGQLGRIAGRLGVIKFVTVDELESKKKRA